MLILNLEDRSLVLLDVGFHSKFYFVLIFYFIDLYNVAVASVTISDFITKYIT